MPSSPTGSVSLSTTTASTSRTVVSPTLTESSETCHPFTTPFAVVTFAGAPPR